MTILATSLVTIKYPPKYGILYTIVQVYSPCCLVNGKPSELGIIVWDGIGNDMISSVREKMSVYYIPNEMIS